MVRKEESDWFEGQQTSRPPRRSPPPISFRPGGGITAAAKGRAARGGDLLTTVSPTTMAYLDHRRGE